MATMIISEYARMSRDDTGNLVPVGEEPAVATQVVSFTTSTASAAFNANTEFIRVIADAKAHFAIAASPTATANSPYIASNTPEYFGLNNTSGLKIAAYDGTS